MTGAEARAIFIRLFGEKAPTAGARRALNCSRQMIRNLCKRERIPTVWALAIKQLCRERRISAYHDALEGLKAEARALSTDKEPSCP